MSDAMKHTPGPWRWTLHENAKIVRLEGGVPTFDLTVMDFVRYGMGRAAPRFREDVERMNIMHRCEEFAVKVPGREHHADWFKAINHPDARLMAAAPDLLAALKGMLPTPFTGNPSTAELVDFWTRENELGRGEAPAVLAAYAAIARAES